MPDSNDALLEALKRTLTLDVRNGPLWLHYAELLQQSGRSAEAIAALRTAAELGEHRRAALVKLIPLLRAAGELDEALVRLQNLLREKSEPALRVEYARLLRDRGDRSAAAREYREVLRADPELRVPDLDGLAGEAGEPAAGGDRPPLGLDRWPAPDERKEPTLAPVTPEPPDPSDLARQLDWGDLYVTFEDVAGLQEVKNQIHLRIVAPFKNPQIYQAFRRTAGGGILLYGPPGCGKTFIARATAGECGARFLAIGIYEIVDKYWGESEKLMHALFEEARRRTPTVLFFDEFDALGSNRGRSESQFWRTLVDQLLQEMDGMGGRNDEVLVFAATNVPWNVDSAFRRPGRFDRIFFVPPPDEAARLQILRQHAGRLPGAEALDLARLAKLTPLFTGADLASLCERASEQALGRSLESNRVHEVTLADFERELGRMESSAQEWIATARNYARYSNESGQYNELIEYLKRVKRW